jgi:hypothetical protein
MNYFLSFIFAVAGISCLVWYKPLYRTYAEFMGQRFHEEFGGLAQKMGWDDPKNSSQLLLYKGSVITAGIFFLVMALHFIFGPISIGNPAQSVGSTSTAVSGADRPMK